MLEKEVAEQTQKLVDEEMKIEDQEKDDDIKTMLEKKSAKDLQQKRSFFVRMVSDPKLYNPHIVKERHISAFF